MNEMHRLLLTHAWLAYFVAAAPGCIGTSPDDADIEALGRDTSGRRAGPEHRPGQPCMACHSDRGGEHPYFAVAGTVYELDGVTWRAGAEVRIVDAQEREMIVHTNTTGNFMVEVRRSLSEPRERGHGELQVPFEPEFPLTVDVFDGENMIGMRSPIRRERSCNQCHGEHTNATSAGRIVIGAVP